MLWRTTPILAVLIAAGCTNPPDSLQLRLEPAKTTFQSGEPIRVTGTLSATTGVVCVDKPTPNRLEIALRSDDSEQAPEQITVVHCGTPFQLVILAYPIVYCAWLLDVADVGGRFLVVEKGKERDFTFQILAREDGYIACGLDDPHCESAAAPYASLPPGDYELRVRFQSEPSGAVPPPLFWSLYEQPVEGCAVFTVE